MRGVLAADNSAYDGVLCDPPYGLGIMGHGWDEAVPDAAEWAAILQAMKPGAHLIAFGAPRTVHRLAIAIEDGGLEIRDQLLWLYTNGMPKARGVLKPAYEPIVLARRPFHGSLKANLSSHGTGILNVDGCRVPYADEADRRQTLQKNPGRADRVESIIYGSARPQQRVSMDGRHPANVLHDGSAGLGDASRLFLCAKASKADRNFGLSGGVDNPHPAVKPLALCRILATLILPPSGGAPRKLLVPFAGSGSEMIGGIMAGWEEVCGIEANSEYAVIARERTGAQLL